MFYMSQYKSAAKDEDVTATVCVCFQFTLTVFCDLLLFICHSGLKWLLMDSVLMMRCRSCK